MWRAGNFFFAVLNAIFLLLNLYYYNRLPAGFPPKLPEGWGALLVALVALSGVLWQTNQALKNLLISQKTQAEITLRQTNNANRYKRLEQRAEKADQKLTLIRALIQELTAGNANLAGLAALCGQLATNYKAQIGQKTDIVVPTIPPFDSVVYKANADKLDILGAVAIGDVIEAYARLEKCTRFPIVNNDPQTLNIAFSAFETAIKQGATAITGYLSNLQGEEKKFEGELTAAKTDIENLEKEKLEG